MRLPAATRRRTLVALAFVALAAAPFDAARVEVLRATGGIPAHLAGQFRDPLVFQQARSGLYFVFDARGHAVYRLDEAMTEVRKVVDIGQEQGRILQPSAFDLDPAGHFVVADAPRGRERIQVFGPAGIRVSGFELPVRTIPRVTIGNVVLNGVGSLQFTGRSVLVNQPETGALFTEYALAGTPLRTFGTLRSTGHERDRDLHMALNTGLPLVNPRGGFYFVFQTGIPKLRKYDAKGELVFERHIEGREVDPVLAAQPGRWPRRTTEDGELPLVPPVVRTAAVDPDGNLWIALSVPYTYVYDADGDKIRTLQLRGATGVVSPSSLAFTPDGRLLVAPGCYEFRR